MKYKGRDYIEIPPEGVVQKQRSVPALRAGIDVGSTTVKLALLDERDNVVWSIYERHHADVRATIAQVLEAAADTVKGELALRRALRVQTAQAKLSARVVVVMPFVLVAAFSLASPDFLACSWRGSRRKNDQRRVQNAGALP